jgi:NADH-quinone oxidoreductase subunit N
MMTGAELTILLPLIAIAAASVLIMLAIAFFRSHDLAFWLTVLAFLAGLALLPSRESLPARVTSLILFDDYSLYYVALIFVSALFVSLLSSRQLGSHDIMKEEYYILLLLAALGSSVLVSAGHFASFFLGLELLSVSLYVLIAYYRTGHHGVEAAVKYLVLAGTSSAVLLFGMSLVYLEFGTLEFSALAANISSEGSLGLAAMAGTALIIAGAAFKLGLVPFHMWMPDVYQGAPSPVTAYVATASKAAIFALLLRYVPSMNVVPGSPLFIILASVAVASMFVGNLLAMVQENVKRLLAYSSIAHMGYLLVAFLASGTLRATAVTYYLTAYSVTMMGAFGVVTALSGGGGEVDKLSMYRGLYRRNPWITAVFTAMLLSLAGIPLTAGFIGKFYIFAAGIDSSLWLLIASLIISSVLGLFYYLRLVAALFTEGDGTSPASGPSVPERLVLALLALLLFWLGVYPGPFIDVLRTMALAG